MPYIDTEQREKYDPLLEPFTRRFELGNFHPGELNYVITKLVLAFLAEQNNYTAYNEVVGVLESVKLELYREKVAPYEDVKLLENGTVYE